MHWLAGRHVSECVSVLCAYSIDGVWNRIERIQRVRRLFSLQNNIRQIHWIFASSFHRCSVCCLNFDRVMGIWINNKITMIVALSSMFHPSPSSSSLSSLKDLTSDAMRCHLPQKICIIFTRDNSSRRCHWSFCVVNLIGKSQCTRFVIRTSSQPRSHFISFRCCRRFEIARWTQNSKQNKKLWILFCSHIMRVAYNI